MKSWLLFLSAFIGLGAYWGAVMMWFAPELLGMNALLATLQYSLPWLDGLLGSFVFPGVMLVLVNGVPNTVAFFVLRKDTHRGAWWQGLCGGLLLGWLAVQWVVFEANPLTTIYTVLGLAQLVLAWILYKRCSNSSI